MATYQFTGRIKAIEVTCKTNIRVSFESNTIRSWGDRYFSMACKCNSNENKIKNWVQIPDSFSINKAEYNLLSLHSDDKFKIKYKVKKKKYKIIKIWLIK